MYSSTILGPPAAGFWRIPKQTVSQQVTLATCMSGEKRVKDLSFRVIVSFLVTLRTRQQSGCTGPYGLLLDERSILIDALTGEWYMMIHHSTCCLHTNQHSSSCNTVCTVTTTCSSTNKIRSRSASPAHCRCSSTAVLYVIQRFMLSKSHCRHELSQQECKVLRTLHSCCDTAPPTNQ